MASERSIDGSSGISRVGFDRASGTRGRNLP